MLKRWVFSLACLGAISLSSNFSHGATTIKTTPYRGWNEAFLLSNGTVEAVVVPAIGRVMQFRFAGQQDGPFWENSLLDGKAPDSQSSEWGNFGGDKSWPAPQADWEKMTGRGWPPPAAFDSMPVTGEIKGELLILRTPIDKHYGIQEERRLRLHPSEAEMEIETIYHKKEGPPVRVSVWTITQLKDPELIVMPLPQKTIFPLGYNKQSAELPLDLKVTNNIVTCRRSPRVSTKIGSDASQLISVHPDVIFETFAAREPNSDFPDQNSSAEIYTNADPLQYIELELLGPLHTLKPGDTITRKQTYRLHKRDARPLNDQLAELISSR